MNFNFLSPVSDAVLAHNELLHRQALGRRLKIHTERDGVPELDGVQLAIIGVRESRNDINYIGETYDFSLVRKAFYALFPGNWFTTVADLGDILPGDSVEDTYFALKTAVSVLIEKQIIPIVIGGSQDLTYPIYRAYDNILPMVNIVNVDSNFDLGDSDQPIKNNSYLGKIILDQPFNLFNYSTIGYQTYFNPQEEIDLMDRLYFEAYRLGEIANNIELAEPVMRDANIVSMDLKSLKASEVSVRQAHSPNGLDGKEVCAVARYAGISNKVSSFGLFEYKMSSDGEVTEMLMAQVLGYFIEGVNCRMEDDDFTNTSQFQKFNVMVENEDLIFYKSLKTGRWWIEIPFLPNVNNKLKKHTLLPCMHSDYSDATNGTLPERWLKACKKNNI